MFSPFLIVPIAALSSIAGGMHYGWSSVALPQISQNDSHIPVTKDEGYWIAAGYFCGSFIGSSLTPFITNLFSQKQCINLSAALLLISWILIAYASSVSELIIARILCGTGDSIALCTMPAYLAEISKPSIRGFVVSSTLVAGMIGMLLINIIGTFTSVKSTALLSLPVPVLSMLLFFFMPDSPYRLVAKNKADHAKKALQQLRSAEDVEEELLCITSAFPLRIAVLKLFTDKYNRKSLYITFGLSIFHVFSGNVALIFHTQYIFTEANGSTSSFVSSVIYLSIQLISSAVAISFMDKVGRRPLLMVSSIGVTITLFVQCGYFYVKNIMNINTHSFNFIPLLGLILFVFAISAGLQTIPLVLLGELFAPSVKFIALGIHQIYFCTLNMGVLKIFQLTNNNFGIHAPFLIFALFNLAGSVFIYNFVPETNKKTLEQIQSDLRGDDRLVMVSEMQPMRAPTTS